MKTSRIVLLIGVVHFVLWWLTYGVLLWFDYDVLGRAQLSPPLQVVFHIHQILTFPLMFDRMNSLVRHWPVAIATAATSCGWACCLGLAIYGFRQIGHVHAAAHLP